MKEKEVILQLLNLLNQSTLPIRGDMVVPVANILQSASEIVNAPEPADQPSSTRGRLGEVGEREPTANPDDGVSSGDGGSD